MKGTTMHSTMTVGHTYPPLSSADEASPAAGMVASFSSSSLMRPASASSVGLADGRTTPALMRVGSRLGRPPPLCPGGPTATTGTPPLSASAHTQLPDSPSPLPSPKQTLPRKLAPLHASPSSSNASPTLFPLGRSPPTPITAARRPSSVESPPDLSQVDGVYGSPTAHSPLHSHLLRRHTVCGPRTSESGSPPAGGLGVGVLGTAMTQASRSSAAVRSYSPGGDDESRIVRQFHGRPTSAGGSSGSGTNTKIASVISFKHEHMIEQRYKKTTPLRDMPDMYTGRNTSTGKCVAIKELNKTELTPANLTQIKTEIKVWHRGGVIPNVVQLIDVYEDNEKLYLVMELITNGTLTDRVSQAGRIPETRATGIFAQLVNAVRHLHSVQIVHGCLRSDNVLFLDQAVKICGTSFSKHAPSRVQPEWTPPEALKKAPPKPAGDMWNLGIILYHMLVGKLPFTVGEGETRDALFDKVRKCEFDQTCAEWMAISEEAKSLIRGLLAADPSQRLSPERVLEHLWLQDSEAPIPVFLRTGKVPFSWCTGELVRAASSCRLRPGSAILSSARPRATSLVNQNHQFFEKSPSFSGFPNDEDTDDSGIEELETLRRSSINRRASGCVTPAAGESVPHSSTHNSLSSGLSSRT